MMVTSHGPTFSPTKKNRTAAGFAPPSEISATLSTTVAEPRPVTIANETKAKTAVIIPIAQ